MTNLGNHVFPVEKYRIIYEKLIQMGIKKENFISPEPVNDEDLFLVHSPKYIKKLKTGSLSHSEIMTLEMSYSQEIKKFAWLFTGGTIRTVEIALEEGMSVHIGGGFHHGFPDHGEGFCMLNDTAVALEKIKKANRIQKAMIVDCDVHQGNGNAYIFAAKDDIFTFSIHQMDLYPAEKPSSSLDIGLWSGDGDKQYLSAMRSHFPGLYEQFQPDLVLYLAGADPYEKDQLGGLNLTEKGLLERDRLVIEEARKRRLPLAILLAGGYAYDVKDTASVHINTIKTALEIHKKYL
ncbi:MAG: histone deacetylase [Candidatus Aminicenantaceae bacterium]